MLRGLYLIPKMDKVVYGQQAGSAVAELAEEYGASRILILASKTLNRTTPDVQNIANALGKRHVGTFDEVRAHTPRSDVLLATRAAREAAADLIVTVGGGSITDAGKMVELCLANGVQTAADLDQFRVRKGESLNNVRADIAPPKVRMVAVPTTLSAAEFTSFAGCTNEEVNHKEPFNHPLNIPRAVVLDPQMTLHTPEKLWLSTGVRGLDHAVEAICSLNALPYVDGAALQAIKLLSRGLRRSKRAPADLEGRQQCQIGAWLAIMGPQSGVSMGASHGIGHVLGGTAGVPHGYTSCVMLPSVLRYNQEVTRERQTLISEAMGRNMTAADAVAELVAELGLPKSLAEVGVSKEQFPLLAEHAVHDSYVLTNPRKIAAPSDIVEILQMAAG